jgi:hypothetical protein
MSLLLQYGKVKGFLENIPGIRIRNVISPLFVENQFFYSKLYEWIWRRQGLSGRISGSSALPGLSV